MRRNAALALIFIALLALSFYLFGYNPRNSPQLSKQPTPPDPAVARQFSASRVVDAELRKSIPSYIGLSITPEHEIKLTLSNRDDFQKARDLATARLAQALREGPNETNRELGRAPFSFVEAPLGPQELIDARAKMRDVLDLPKTVYMGIDQSCGCIVVGILDSSAEASVRSFATQQGLPLAAVKTVVTPPIVKFASLTDWFRPAMGGVQIQFSDGPGLFDCSLGLPVFSFSQAKWGFLTASHCTAGTRGAMLGTWIAQPGGAVAWGDKIGVESMDRAMFGTLTDSRCSSGRTCRLSDAAFIAFDKADLGIIGRIIRPQNRCVGTSSCDVGVLRKTDDIRVVLADASDPNFAPMIGDVIEKVGRTTGWSSGALSLNCVNVKVTNDDGTDSGMTIICQNLVLAASGPGDSGSPVFAFNQTTGTAMFEGILWGGATDGSNFVYSPVSGIETDLGTFAYNEVGVTAPFSSGGEFQTSDTNDDISVTVEPNAVPPDQIAIVLTSASAITWKKQLVLAGGGNPPANVTLTVINAVKTDSGTLQADQLPGSHMEFRKLYFGSQSATSEVSRVPLDAVPPGTRLTFTWTRD
jgi:hypothetical protein